MKNRIDRKGLVLEPVPASKRTARTYALTALCILALCLVGSAHHAMGANQGSKYRNRDLWQAVENQDVDLADSLLKNKADPNSIPEYQTHSVLMLASEKGNVELINLLLANGADPNLPITKGNMDLGQTALFLALKKGHLGAAKALIQGGGKVNVQAGGGVIYEGVTPLMVAASIKQGSSLVQLVLDSGADVSAKRSDGMTALAIAVTTGVADDSVKLLLDANADAILKTKDGDLLTIAAAAEKIGIVRLLLARKFPRESKDMALLQSCYRGNVEIVKLLLANGADPNAQDKRPKSAIRYALEKGHADVVDILKKAGAKDQPEVTTETATSVQPINSEKVTKTEWRAAVAPFDVTSTRFGQVFLGEASFKARFGKPLKEQRVGDSAYWYYRCADGELQVVIKVDFLEQQGVMIQSINEF